MIHKISIIHNLQDELQTVVELWKIQFTHALA